MSAVAYDDLGRIASARRGTEGLGGKVDNLHIYYDGNRITGVLDDALPVTQNGSMDFPVSGKEMAMEYNGWGALVKDQGRGISDISYDRLGNPLRISYSNGAYTEYVYSATGEKLRMTHGTSLNAASTGMEPYGDMESAEDTASEPMAAASSATSVTEYHGNVIYRDGKVDMVLFPGGYATINGTSVTFHYYTQDYLGNNRAVINGTTGAIEQTTAYYPYGGVIADLGNPHGGQPYRFGGKELITANGLNEYDFGARWYYSVLLHFTAVDPSCEKYYWLSPYLYCANNPIMLIDKDGCDPVYDTRGNFLGVDDRGLQGNPIVMDKNNFENGMSHEAAAGYACNPMDERIWERIKRHHSSLRYRPDYDGVVTMTEGIAWAKAHPNALKNPTPDNMLYIDVSKLDFGPLSVSDFKRIGEKEPQNLYENAFSTLWRARKNSRYRDTVYALGRCNMILLDPTRRLIMIVNDEATDYDWNGGGSIMRQLSIFVNNLSYGIDKDIHGFKTFYYGIGTLNQ